MPSPRHLIVLDEEPDFCDLVARVAKGLGYSVTKLHHAGELEAASTDSRADVVMIDKVTSKRDGSDFATWVAQASSAARVLLVSGSHPVDLDAAAAPLRAQGRSDVHCLTKPLDLTKLRKILR